MTNSYLITGGTGSFGKAFLKNIIKSRIKISRLVIFSRDEFKQSQLQSEHPKNKYPFLPVGILLKDKCNKSSANKIPYTSIALLASVSVGTVPPGHIAVFEASVHHPGGG